MGEPTTNGKVILKTSLGDLEIELWSRETPKASRNFVQLCLEKYYDGCIFHRIVHNYIAQTGDPSGTGNGGESIYDGEPFKDEFHSRLRFSRRGMVGMASLGDEPNSNQSQFFITLDGADRLTKKHTLFGKVVGDSLFNILKANELEVDENDQPLFPPKIITTDVIWNPFEDCIPRPDKLQLNIKRNQPQQTNTNTNVKKKPILPVVKNKGLLSFGDDQDDEDSGNNDIKKKPPVKSTTPSKPITKPAPPTTTTTTTTTTKKQEELEQKKKEEDIKKTDTEQKQIEQDNVDKQDTKKQENIEKSFDEKMRESIIKKTSGLLKRDRVDDEKKQDNNDTKSKEIKKTKVVGSLQFKSNQGSSGMPRASRKNNANNVLEKLERFKNSLHQGSKSEDDDWKLHSLKFTVDPSSQERYM